MKIYDISQELLSCCVFDGDPSPELKCLSSIERGDICNVSTLSMCLHNGTHVDAPLHFIHGGDSVKELKLEQTVGYAYVAQHNGMLLEDDAKAIVKKAKSIMPESGKRILLKGKATVTAEGAEVFAGEGTCLVGNESQSVGSEDAPLEVHKILLGAKVVLLEGIRLEHVPEGVYLLCCAPLCISGGDGAPCRAILIDIDN